MGFGILNGTSIGLLNLSLGFNSVGFYQVNLWFGISISGLWWLYLLWRTVVRLLYYYVPILFILYPHQKHIFIITWTTLYCLNGDCWVWDYCCDSAHEKTTPKPNLKGGKQEQKEKIRHLFSFHHTWNLRGNVIIIPFSILNGSCSTIPKSWWFQILIVIFWMGSFWPSLLIFHFRWQNWQLFPAQFSWRLFSSGSNSGKI